MGEVFVKEVKLPHKLVIHPNSGLYFKTRIIKPIWRNTCVVFQPDFQVEGLEIPAVLASTGSEIILQVLNLSDRFFTIPAKPSWEVSLKQWGSSKKQLRTLLPQ
jgi:hypothetical protein